MRPALREATFLLARFGPLAVAGLAFATIDLWTRLQATMFRPTERLAGVIGRPGGQPDQPRLHSSVCTDWPASRTGRLRSDLDGRGDRGDALVVQQELKIVAGGRQRRVSRCYGLDP